MTPILTRPALCLHLSLMLVASSALAQTARSRKTSSRAGRSLPLPDTPGVRDPVP